MRKITKADKLVQATLKGMFLEKTCPCCGKRFVIRKCYLKDYVFKTKATRKQKTGYYCSWTCYKKGNK